ncbi:MAG: polysaccharide biosynthesis/export family protein [Bacteroidales bacterium]|nr:polysaccharide biosynthesis/export family protein [Bacteroidales bacterium]
MKKYLLLLMTIVVVSSCKSNKDIVYIKDMEPLLEYYFNADKETVVQPNDLLDIVVSCKRPELAVPFNTRHGAVTVDSYGALSTLSEGASTSESAYRVNKNGDITFPILGKVHVAGYRLTQVADIIREKIITGDYIKDPQVSVDLLNFKYTVLGAVGSNGTFTVDGDRITLLEAIANAGDVSANGRTDNVKIIREEDGKRMVLVHDLRNTEIFDSPYFYLKPNDLVYVEAKYKKKDKEDRTWQYLTFILSLVSTTCTVIWATK